MEANDLHNLDYYQSLTGKAAIEERLKGRLPIIVIEGHPFFVDVRIGLLRPKDNFSTMGIDLSRIPMDPKTKQLSFYYHVPTMTEVQITKDLKELPKDVVLVRVPNMYLLDPVAMAKVNDKDNKYYLSEIPLKMYRKARVIPLQKTELATKIKNNINQQQKPEMQNNKALVQQRKRRKGI